MTPREPDRFDAQARAMFEWLDHRFGKECGHNHAHDNDPLPHPQGARPDTYAYLAAALRAAVSQALEDAAQLLHAEVTNEERYGMAQAAFSDAEDMVRALIPPAAAPAAETGTRLGSGAQ